MENLEPKPDETSDPPETLLEEARRARLADLAVAMSNAAASLARTKQFVAVAAAAFNALVGVGRQSLTQEDIRRAADRLNAEAQAASEAAKSRIVVP